MLDHPDLDPQLNALLGAPHWYVGYSGGVDSTVLLHLLQQWCAAHERAPALSAIHINHGLQAPADDWQRHCADTCRSLQVEFIALSVDVAAAGSGEQGARDARYAAFTRVLEPGAVLFLGHHLDDQVETFFLRLLRGAGVEGLAAMPRRRALGEGDLVRPLLDSSRSELEDYAARHDLAWIEDPSNRDTSMDRNFLRRDVLPVLSERWPAYRDAVARASGHMSDAASALADVPETLRSVMGDSGLSLDALTGVLAQSAAHRLRAWLRVQGWQAPEQASLAEFLRQLRDVAEDGSPRLDCGRYCLQRYRDGVYRLPDFGGPAPRETVELAPGDRCEVPGVGAFSLHPCGGNGLCLAPGEPLALRWREGGERCRLPGRSGSHSLKALFQEWHVPPWWRERIPLLYLGGELVAVGDIAPCESARWQVSAGESEQLWRLAWERPPMGLSD